MNAAALEHQTVALRESMNELWRVNGTALTRFALKLTLGDKHRAEDLIQETLVRAWRHPEVVDGRADLIRSWLFTICRRVSIDTWRANSRHNNYIIEDHPTDTPNPIDCIDQAVTVMDVRAALAQLKPEHRQVIVETYYHGRSVAEIATRLGIPEGTVKSRSYYGLRQLKRLLSASSGEQAEWLPNLLSPALAA
jgi:RNA polymerase sigma-70 factor (ECF subfamily)